MNIKTLHRALQYQPDKVEEFILLAYGKMDPECKAAFSAIFQDFFEREGQGINERLK